MITSACDDAGDPYRVNATRPDGAVLVVASTAGGLSATFGKDGFVLHPHSAQRDRAPWQATVRVDGFGCRTDPSPLSTTEPPTTTDGGRVEQDLGAMRAWYADSDVGIEQGFLVPSAPACSTRDSTMTVAMSVDGLSARLDRRGDVELLDDAQRVVASYRGLHVVDARDRTLSANLRVDPHHLYIDVDTRGADFPVVIDPVWTQVAKLTASDGAPTDGFGAVVGLSGDSIIIGAGLKNVVGGASGAAYAFVRNGDVWTEEARLLPDNPSFGDFFGYSVGLSGDTAVIGAYRKDTTVAGSGEAFVFRRSAGVWTQEAALIPSDVQQVSSFGTWSAIDGDTVAVGASTATADPFGAAYVFVRSGNTWTEQAKLMASTPEVDDFYGLVALNGDTLLVSAQRHDVPGQVDAGVVYVFVRSGSTWSQQAELVASDGLANDWFGVSLALDGDTAVVGAMSNDELATDCGAAYVFVRNGTTWTQEAKLLPSDGQATDRFGRSVALSGDTLIVGAINQDQLGANAGAAYVFVRNGTTWTEETKLLAADGAAGDLFGAKVSMDGRTAVIGAFHADTAAGADAGAAYVFDVHQSDGESCAADSECLSGFCRDGVCCDSDCGGNDLQDCQSCAAVDTGLATDGVCAPVSAASAHVCRGGSNDLCDPDEVCDGVDSACPADVVAAAGTVCRAGTDDTCDPDEVCEGTSGAACPADATAPNGTTCADGSCLDGACVPGQGGGGNGQGGGPSGGAPAMGGGGGASAGGNGGNGNDGDSNDCSCKAVGEPVRTGRGLVSLGLLLMALARRRQR
ncbi:MAG: hypothetical protein U0271_01445 [Polyangiaceae bacterium]